MRKKNIDISGVEMPSLKLWGMTLLVLAISTALGFLFHTLNFTDANTITIYILGALLTALFTKNHICSIAFSLASVFLFNFLFTEPRLSFAAYESGYPVTFAIMLIASLITGTLAIENIRNAKEKEQIALHAKNEELRANLLRMISHDLRTPLTSISGNTENLLTNFEQIDEETRHQLLSDVYGDTQWLITLVENLLSITRISEGRMNLNISAQLVDEVVSEALKHVDRKGIEHKITMKCDEELLLADMDARLITQVIINLVDNAIKYTPKGSHILISGKEAGKYVEISVADDGYGIPDEQKADVFQMFYTGEHQVADCRRSLGLGLALCESIVNTHGGTMTLKDNQPSGCIFTFTLPRSEVNLNE